MNGLDLNSEFARDFLFWFVIVVVVGIVIGWIAERWSNDDSEW